MFTGRLRSWANVFDDANPYRRAVEAFKLLDPIGISLLNAVRGYLDGHQQRTASISFADLFDAYLEAKQDRNPAYLRELRITRNRMPQLHARLVSDISSRDLEPILNQMTPGARNPVMRYLRAVFNFGTKRGFLAENPISRLDFADRQRREVVTVPVDQVTRMLNHALAEDLGLLPYLVFGFFAGELLKLQWADVKDTSEQSKGGRVDTDGHPHKLKQLAETGVNGRTARRYEELIGPPGNAPGSSDLAIIAEKMANLKDGSNRYEGKTREGGKVDTSKDGSRNSLARHFLRIYPEVFADTSRGVLFDLCMPRNGRGRTLRVLPDRMLGTFADFGAFVLA